MGNEFFDQWRRSGHGRRLTDLDRIASLGIRTVRQSVLWERVAPDCWDEFDWSDSDTHLARLKELGIEPIVGLLHHGSGPAYTSLLDPEFPVKLATYARAVAERYPHASMYTPVNEPLTTARFSALYGLWYPHATNGLSFARALLNEVKGTVLAMREIRKVNPRARLVQTEDLGKTYATAKLAEQAAFENERRWLTWDLLTGRLDRQSLLYRHFVREGVSEAELEWFLENPCPPDILGVNTYVTSERFLDHRLDRYPPHTHGGNAYIEYADVEAVRVMAGGIDGPEVRLAETWDRYGLPVAITECHLGCTREEQARWLTNTWEAANRLKSSGVDVRAVTVWSMFGAYDWNNLLCRDAGCYEPGVFDLRGPLPRETALASVVRSLSRGERPDLPWLDGPGWWERPIRLLYPPVVNAVGESVRSGSAVPDRSAPGRPLLIVGNGRIARAMAAACEVRGLAYLHLGPSRIDPVQRRSVDEAIEAYEPWAVVNAFGFEDVDRAERALTECFRDNTVAPMLLAKACAQCGVRYLGFSTDLLFDGRSGGPFVETDEPWPISVYGRSKWEAEYRVAESGADALIVRTGPLFDQNEGADFLGRVLASLRLGQTYRADGARTFTPTYLPDLCTAALDLLQDDERGIWHLAHPEPLTWFDFAVKAAQVVGEDESLIEPTLTGAGRPLSTPLASARGTLLPSLDDALLRWAEREAASAAPEDGVFLA